MPERQIELGTQNTAPAIPLFDLPGFQTHVAAFGFTTQRARDNRLLAEIRAPQQAQDTFPGQITERVSTLSGSRRGNLENRSAYDAIFKDPQRSLEAQNAIAWFGKKYLEAHNKTDMTVEDVHRVATIAMYATVYAMYHAQGFGPDGQLPTVLADTFKIFQGIHSAALSMEGDTGSRPIQAEEIYTYAEANRLLITPPPDIKACPAPKNMINFISGLLINGGDTKGKVNANGSVLNEIFPTPAHFNALETFASYSQRYAEIMDALSEAVGIVVGAEDMQNLSSEQRVQLDSIFAQYQEPMQTLQEDVNTQLGRSTTHAPLITPQTLAHNAKLDI